MSNSHCLQLVDFSMFALWYVRFFFTENGIGVPFRIAFFEISRIFSFAKSNVLQRAYLGTTQNI